MASSDELLRLTRRMRLPAEQRVRSLCWRPAADVYRTDEGWLVKFELAGVRDEHVELRLHDRFLILSGTRHDTGECCGATSHAMEIAYSRFERVIELTEELRRARLVTEFREGMLLVRIITEGSR